jgi:hypothetical protein
MEDVSREEAALEERIANMIPKFTEARLATYSAGAANSGNLGPEIDDLQWEHATLSEEIAKFSEQLTTRVLFVGKPETYFKGPLRSSQPTFANFLQSKGEDISSPAPFVLPLDVASLDHNVRSDANSLSIRISTKAQELSRYQDYLQLAVAARAVHDTSQGLRDQLAALQGKLADQRHLVSTTPVDSAQDIATHESTLAKLEDCLKGIEAVAAGSKSLTTLSVPPFRDALRDLLSKPGAQDPSMQDSVVLPCMQAEKDLEIKLDHFAAELELTSQETATALRQERETIAHLRHLEEEERKRLEMERLEAVAEERERLAEELRLKQEEEDRLRREEEEGLRLQQEEEERQRVELEETARLQAALEAKRLAEEELQARLVEAARLQAEHEALRVKQEEERLRAEQEAKAREEEERARKEAEERENAQKVAEEEARLLAIRQEEERLRTLAQQLEDEQKRMRHEQEMAREREEAERLLQEQREIERKREEERLQYEREERERLEHEQAEKDRLEREQAEKGRLELERREQEERSQREKAEQERKAREREEERKQREREEAERIEREHMQEEERMRLEEENRRLESLIRAEEEKRRLLEQSELLKLASSSTLDGKQNNACS